MIKALTRRFIALTRHQETGEALALFRLGVAATVFSMVAFAYLSGAWELFWLDRSSGGFVDVSQDHWLISLIGVGEQQIIGLQWATLLSSSLLFVGVLSRLNAFIVLQLCLALFSLTPMSGGGHDRLITNALWLLVLADSDRTWSMRAKLSTGSFSDNTLVSSWPRYLMALQLVIMYTATGLQKISPEWHFSGGYSAVFYALNTPEWRRWDNSWAASVFPLTQLATISAYLYEAGAAVWLLVMFAEHNPNVAWKRWMIRLKVRWFLLLTGVILHLGLWFFMNLGPFQAITLSYYASLFTGPQLRGYLSSLGFFEKVPTTPAGA